CCHFQCLGGCSGPSASDCYVCRYQNYNGTCMITCPTGTYEVLSNRSATILSHLTEYPSLSRTVSYLIYVTYLMCIL
ncbi:uncharacterized protein TRIADDRAFT_34842, partial [Trichoplax adhaerens]